MPTPFERMYAQLNDAQKASVDTIDGPVMVVAGPGTGKTQVLALRLANILQKTDVQPHNVLALTFTDAAARNMRERLLRFIGPTAYQVEIKTFHSFCEDVIRAHPEAFVLDRESEPLDDLERFEIVRMLLQNPELRALRTPSSRYHYVKDIQKDIADLKKEGVTPERFDELVTQEQTTFESEKAELKKVALATRESLLAKHHELALLYHQYQEELTKRKRYDFEDMIIETVRAFKEDATLLLEYQERFQYVLVDEYQDTNSAQNTVVFLLTSYWGEDANLFVVGDPNQTIYRFQGATLENTKEFLETYPKATVITLDVGYRCPQSIYTAAASLFPSLTPLTSVQATTEQIPFTIAPTSLLELDTLAHTIQTIHESPEQSIAVLCKKNSLCDEVATVLRSYSLTYTIERGQDILASTVVQQLITLLRVIHGLPDRSEQDALFPLLNFEWTHLDPLLVMKLTRATGNSRTHTHIYDLVREGHNAIKKLRGCENVTALELSSIETFFDTLVQWKANETNRPFIVWLSELLELSGLLPWVLQQEEMAEMLCDLTALFDEARSWNERTPKFSLSEFLSRIDTMTEHHLTLERAPSVADPSAVTIATVHKAKGREWDHVFIPMLHDGNWGNTRSPAGIPLPEGILANPLEKSDRNDDERRLFYVALTRAKHQVHLSTTSDEVPSQFLTELPQELLSQETLESSALQLEEAQKRHLAPPVIQTWREDQKAWLQEIANNLELSISTLNTYLRSPKEFYLNSILKVPRSKPTPLAFGTAIHSALEFHYQHLHTHDGVHPPLEQTISKFEDTLSHELLSEEDKIIRLRQGKELLESYLTERKDRIVSVLTTEEGFGWKRGKVMLGDISLTGKIDRIDWLDQSENTVRLIDYKTGHHKTVGEIEGSTLSAGLSEREQSLPEAIRGPLKRQLLFYKLLMKLDRAYQKLSIGQAVFDFVETKNGKTLERAFTLKDEDVTALEELIKTVMHEIRELKFLDEL